MLYNYYYSGRAGQYYFVVPLSQVATPPPKIVTSLFAKQMATITYGYMY